MDLRQIIGSTSSYTCCMSGQHIPTYEDGEGGGGVRDLLKRG